MDAIKMKDIFNDLFDAGIDSNFMQELAEVIDSINLKSPQTFHEKKIVFLRSRIREQREYIHEINNDTTRSHDRKCEIIQSARAVKMRLEMQLGSLFEHIIEQRRKEESCRD